MNIPYFWPNRESREKRNLLLRQVAAYLEVDTAFISKVERGERTLNRNQVIKISNFLKEPTEELLSMWICDKIISTTDEDEFAMEGIKKAVKLIRNKWRIRK